MRTRIFARAWEIMRGPALVKELLVGCSGRLSYPDLLPSSRTLLIIVSFHHQCRPKCGLIQGT
jgi:hypothetical protein